MPINRIDRVVPSLRAICELERFQTARSDGVLEGGEDWFVTWRTILLGHPAYRTGQVGWVLVDDQERGLHDGEFVAEVPEVYSFHVSSLKTSLPLSVTRPLLGPE